MNLFLDKLCDTYSLSKASAQTLLEKMELIVIHKGEFIVREGERNNNLYILKHGICRAFRYNDGEEVTMWFAMEGELVCPVWGYVANTASQENIEVEDETEAYVLSKERIDELCATSLEMSNIIRTLFERQLYIVEEYLLFWADNMSAKQRYVTIMKKEPDLLQRISLRKLASYLLITPQSLSRIRAELK